MAFTATTTNSAYPWRPDVSVHAAPDVLPDALILQCSTKAGEVDGDMPAVRVAFVDDDNATFVAEAAEIPEGEPKLAECIVHTGNAAQLIRISRSQYQQAGTAEQLALSVGRALTRKADEAFLVQPNPVAPAVNPAGGILSHPDIIKGGTVTANLDALVDLVAEIQDNGGAASHILCGPKAWASLRKLKTATDHNTSLIGAGTTDAQELLLSLPVIVNPAVPANTGVVLDRRAVVSAIGPVLVSVSDQVYFTSSSIALKAEWRFGQNLVRPDRVGTFQIGAGTRTATK